MWVATADLPKSAGHPFYAQLNRVLDDAGFDTFVEAQCAQFYADGIGRPSLAPGRYFRLLLLGYFEGLDSERAIAWRAADSLSIRQFLDFALHEAPPDHSTLSRTRRLIDVETHQAVFTWVLQRLADAHLVEGHTIGIDATTLEANAAMRSIVRRDTGEAYEAWLTRLAEASGIATPTRAELARFDRKRKKKGSNEDWTHPHDPDAKITKMKDGRTHLAHTAEHAVDLETGAIVGVTVQDADAGDTTTMVDTLIEAADQVAAVDGASGIAEVVGDTGYHSNETMVGFADLGVRSYVSEPDRGRRKWKGKAAAKKAVYANRRRIRGNRGQRLLRQRGERVERPNAHLYETGGMRRVHLRGHPNILKRLLVHVCGFNLGLLMRQLTGVGTPRSLQGRAAALLGALIDLLGGLCERLKRSWAPGGPRCAGFVVGETGDRSIRTHDPRFTKSPFCHGLLDELDAHRVGNERGRCAVPHDAAATTDRAAPQGGFRRLECQVQSRPWGERTDRFQQDAGLADIDGEAPQPRCLIGRPIAYRNRSDEAWRRRRMPRVQAFPFPCEQQMLHLLPQRGRCEGLQEKGVRGPSHRVLHIRAINRVSRDEQDSRLWVKGRHPSGQRKPVHLGDDDIRHEQVERRPTLVGNFQGFAPVRSLKQLVPKFQQEPTQQ